MKIIKRKDASQPVSDIPAADTSISEETPISTIAGIAEDITSKPPDLKEVLIKGSYLTEEDIKKAEQNAAGRDRPLEEHLLSEGLITRELLSQAMAEAYGVPYADIAAKTPSAEMVTRIPEETARQFHVVLYKEEDAHITVATDNPKQQELINKMNVLFPGKSVDFAYASETDIESLYIHYRKPLETRFAEIIKSGNKIAPEIIKEIFKDALSFHASDIHFEPHTAEVAIRFRVDGVLHEAGTLPKDLYENILNRVKVESHLRIDEHLSPQDGAMRFDASESIVDMRVSIIPTLSGEKIAIRLLAEYIKGFTLSDIGLSPANQNILANAAKKPFGMILVTGPTGSGKTTTLYALLKMVHRPEVNITTIEDPVEYRIEGVNQIQVNEGTNLNFARGLRSIVRQDPNIILVGEIRDTDTAEIAVNAALTGHLLLSTFHANDAATSIPRLLEMGVEPFLLASTLEVVIAQRLVRKLCENCRYSTSISKTEFSGTYPKATSYLKENEITLYKAKGCTSCSFTGFKGRTGVFEFIDVTPEIEQLILSNPSAQQIREMAEKEGNVSLFEDGMEKVKSGITTIDELLRVAAPPEKYEKPKTRRKNSQ
ncbi:MAG: general secretion pathway protein E, general secretion pathway protein E [candidate division WWE3 bacterium GW2011_GWC1_41_7]|uniref:General secretion pathway protein E, general secretion pathway protein E n=3 Tax=Katanobacteria TaxID=422282 RepID=A0A0G0X641_UNCKA|nr:MAG: Type II secretion system protein E [candidate division WWE3 bacterium GW2011_GWB1_41_6]KKS20534.1 MAG: general secretion pathway protein E, general secretion pathway protein E [candidate division WWE3 bacterium GW2011_GWC1_41_7]KKS22706.1 MAG: Type II secretion system protein E [candidate division WWE3 bacterium GW2011_GWA1_41_8]